MMNTLRGFFPPGLEDNLQGTDCFEPPTSCRDSRPHGFYKAERPRSLKKAVHGAKSAGECKP
jgi:hypothetical protein